MSAIVRLAASQCSHCGWPDGAAASRYGDFVDLSRVWVHSDGASCLVPMQPACNRSASFCFLQSLFRLMLLLLLSSSPVISFSLIHTHVRTNNACVPHLTSRRPVVRLRCTSGCLNLIDTIFLVIAGKCKVTCNTTCSCSSSLHAPKRRIQEQHSLLYISRCSCRCGALPL